MHTTLLKGAKIVNVFTDELESANLLITDDHITGFSAAYTEADTVIDLSGKYICPGLIDGHIHIESTMLQPDQFVRAALPHGTTCVIADPHEIANVCGTDGIRFMMEASRHLPMDIRIALPSCVPATPFDESYAPLEAEELEAFYDDERVVSLGEVMSYPDVVARQSGVMAKIARAKARGRIINGHAPMLTGKGLDQYIAAGIGDDHECTAFTEGLERIRKGQWVMIRQGTSARDLEALILLLREPWSRRCMLVTDDKHPADLLKGHLDATIRQAIALGASPMAAIRAATLQPASYYRLDEMGAIAPGRLANILVLDDLAHFSVSQVWYKGRLAAENGQMVLPLSAPQKTDLEARVRSSFHLSPLTPEQLQFTPTNKTQHVIEVIPGKLITNDFLAELDFTKNNGIDTGRDILKIAVCERHRGTGHIGLGFIKGLGLKRGAIASSVSHDSHNLIIVGTNEADMVAAGNHCMQLGGGMVVADQGRILSEMPLPIGGLMTDVTAEEASRQNEQVRLAVHSLGAPTSIEPFMNMAFVSLTVIPHLKLTCTGMVDVDAQRRV